jgi:E-phenylitaconyl-CoA hydratase
MTNTGLAVSVEDGIAILRLDRPQRGNAVDAGVQRALKQAWAQVREDRSIRAAVITGSGERHFCTGGDVAGLDTQGDTALVNAPFQEAVAFSPLQNRVFKPVICAVNGLACGAGLHFVVDADIIVASENASFLDTHVNVGQVGAIENIGLMKRLPIGTALRMTLQGKSYRLTARRAYELGMVDELVRTSAEVLPKALEIAREIAANSPQAVALSKQALWESLESGYTQACANGWNLLRLQWSHPDFVEGPQAFLERRAPAWNPDPDARR